MRRDLPRRIRSADWRDPARPLLWTHAPSVGEGLQARPVLAALRARHPEWQLLHTYYSPSATLFAERLLADGLVDHVEVLPFDGRREARLVLDAWRPDVLAFTKLDVWPVLTHEAVRRGVRPLLLSATLSPNSGRRGVFARALLGDAYRALDAVGAISADDAQRLVALGVRAERVQVSGDTRVDQVAERAATVPPDDPLLVALRQSDHRWQRTLVAGSTWPADERPLLTALATRVSEGRPWRVVLVPHEPTPPHLAPLLAWAESNALRVTRLSAIERGDSAAPWDVLLVDRVGVLGTLYALADVAFVGGGFHDKGLHSVLEPAAFGVPVLFGPQHANAREAALLLADGAAFEVADALAIGERLDQLLHDDERRTAGAAARRFVDRNRGATEKSVEMIEVAMANGAVPRGTIARSTSGDAADETSATSPR